MSYTPVNHSVTVEVASPGSVSPNPLAVKETDTVTFIPNGGTIIAIVPDLGQTNLFSSGPSPVPSSDHWLGTVGNITGSEKYKILAQPTGGSPYWIDPKLQVDQPG